MADDTAPDQNDEPIFDNPALEKTFDAMCDAFFDTAVEQKLTQMDGIRVLASAAAAIAANIFYGIAPDTPIQDQPQDAKDAYRAALLGMINDDLRDVLSVPVDLGSDDEETNPAEIMPGLSRVH